MADGSAIGAAVGAGSLTGAGAAAIGGATGLARRDGATLSRRLWRRIADVPSDFFLVAGRAVFLAASLARVAVGMRILPFKMSRAGVVRPTRTRWIVIASPRYASPSSPRHGHQCVSLCLSVGCRAIRAFGRWPLWVLRGARVGSLTQGGLPS